MQGHLPKMYLLLGVEAAMFMSCKTTEIVCILRGRLKWSMGGGDSQHHKERGGVPSDILTEETNGSSALEVTDFVNFMKKS